MKTIKSEIKINFFKIVKLKILIITFLFFLFCLSNCQIDIAFKDSPKAQNGLLNLIFWEFEKKGPIILEGEWLFFRNEFIEPNTSELNLKPNSIPFEVPGVWNEHIHSEFKFHGYGYGSYYLKVLLPKTNKKQRLGFRMKEQSTAYKLFINGEYLTGRGKISTNPENSIPQYGSRTIFFETNEEALHIILHISNYHHRNGGMWSSPVLANQDQINLLQYERNFIEFILGGSILIITIYHFMLFFFRRNDRPSFYFAIFCSITFMRIISTGEIMLIQLLPDIPLEIVTKLEYISFFLLGPTFLKFYSELFKEDISEKVTKFFMMIGLCLTMLVIFSNFRIYNYFVDLNYIILVFIIVISYFYLVKVIIRKREDSFVLFIFTHFLLFFVINDILNTLRIIHTSDLVQIGVFVFLLGQSIVVSRRLSKAFRDVEILSEKLNIVNKTYSKFVPEQFLNFFGKKSILEIEIGDFAEKEITVLFSGIRGFISLTEKLGTKEIIVFLNKYYFGVTEIVNRNKGFIDKFVGDDITVIFPDSPEDALKAANEICIYLNEFNLSKISPDFPDIKIGIGIHTGKAHFGTIGGNGRMDTTLIGDTIMIARLIENLTKVFHVPVLLTFQTYSMIDGKNKKFMREVDTTKVRGREGLLTVYEYFEFEPEIIRNKKNLIAQDFFTGLTQYRAGLINKAKEIFHNCNLQLPEDPIFIIYLNRCNDTIISKDNSSSEMFVNSKVNVLISDDNQAIIDYLELILKKENLEVIIAKNINEFKNLARKISPQLIFLSYKFENKFSDELIIYIRETLRLGMENCYIAITTSEDNIDKKNLYEMGANDIILKPFSLDEIQKITYRIKI